ncbi:MAG: HNH endonuclease [Clostridium sp.]|nr:HNH endonuclease [Clostridium sp.]
MGKRNSLTQQLGVGKGRFKKAILDGLLLSNNDPSAYEYSFKQFNNCCAYCGMSGDTIQLSADHLIPSSKGGRFIKGNIIPACQKCNSLRRDLTLEEFVSDKSVLEKIKHFQSLHKISQSEINLGNELGENGKMILKQLDMALILLRDVARNAIRANETNKEIPLKEWVDELKEITKKYGLI